MTHFSDYDARDWVPLTLRPHETQRSASEAPGATISPVPRDGHLVEALALQAAMRELDLLDPKVPRG